MVDAVRLATACADLDIVGETGLDNISTMLDAFIRTKVTYSHGSMQGASNVIILLQPRAAAQDLRQPELPDSTLHVSDLALSRGRGLDPLGRLAANTTDHVGMCKGLGRPLLVLGIESRGNWLGNSRMQRRCPAGDYQIIVALVAGRRAGIAIARPRTGEGGVCGQRGGHVRV